MKLVARTDTQCSLFKYFNPKSNKYKLINGTNCLDSIPDGAGLLDEKLSLLKCKDGYRLEDNTCLKTYNLL